MAGEELPAVESPPFAEVPVGASVVALLRDGEQTYPAMLRAIASARASICLETYTLRDDGTGWRFARALAERARAGVEVNVLYDAWGSRVSGGFLAFLREAGVRVVAFHPIRFRGRLGELLLRLRKRDHRKILLVDGRVGFTGGLNVADEYAARAHGGRGWRDTHVRIEGPAAKELLEPFLRVWRRSRGPEVEERRYQLEGRRPDPWVRVISSEGHRGRLAIRRAYLRAIRGARRRVWITAAYFLPPLRILRALRQAARRGVDVRVIVAGETDVRVVLLAARALYGPLIRAGVRIHEFRGRVLHAKTAAVDGRWGTVGSSNLDHLSMLKNLEANAVVENPRFAAALEDLFLDDLRQADEVTPADLRRRPLHERFVSWLAYLFRGWL